MSARVAELADAIGLGPIEIYLVGVQLSPWAPNNIIK